MSKFEIKIPKTSFTLKEGMYQIVPKTDASAPDGFKEHGTTKVISPDIGNTVHAPFNSDLEVWDTGFFKSSPVLRGMSDAEKELHLKQVHEHIVKPVEEIKGEGALRHNKDNKFFDDFGIVLKANRFVNTEEPLERLGLYLAILGRHLAPKDGESNPIYGAAQYAIVNREETVNIRQEKEYEKSQAIGLFHTLIRQDRDKLHELLSYLKISGSRQAEPQTLNSIFNRWLDDKTHGFQNSKIFIETYDKFDTEDGEEELYTFKKIKELESAGLIKQKRGEIFLDGKAIGASYKLAASYLMSNKDDKQKFASLVEKLEE